MPSRSNRERRPPRFGGSGSQNWPRKREWIWDIPLNSSPCRGHDYEA